VTRAPTHRVRVLACAALELAPAAAFAQVGPPVRVESLPVEGATLVFEVRGEGDPLLVLNGGPGWSSAHMRPVADRLASGRVVLFDQRGTGRSRVALPLDSTRVTLDLMLDDIERLRERLGVESLDLLGHSFGGMLAMAYTARHPERVRSLVLSAPGGPDLGFLSWYQTSLSDRVPPDLRAEAARWSRPETLASGAGRASLHIIRSMLPAFLVDEEALPVMEAALDTTTWNLRTSGLVWADLARIGFDVRERLGSFRGLVLVIQGRQDALGDHLPHETAALFRDAELRILEGAAHILWLDRPDAYYEAIEGFLERTRD